MAVVIQLQFDVGSADQAQAAVRAVHQEVSRLNLATGPGANTVGNFRSQVTQLGSASETGGRGLHAIRGALLTLTDQMSGASPIIGRLTSSIFALGAGQEITLAAVAGITLIVGAYKLFTQEADTAKKANAALLTSLAEIGPTAARNARLATLQTQLRAITGEATAATILTPGGAAPRILITPESIELEAKRRGIIQEITRLEAEITKENKKQREEIEKIIDLRPHRVFAQDASRLIRPPTDLGLRGTVSLKGEHGGLATQDPTLAIAEANARLAQEAAERFRTAAGIAVTSFGAMAQAAITGSQQIGTAIIGMVTNILSQLPSVSPLAGSIIGAAGGILGSLFGSGSSSQPLSVRVEEYGPRAEDQLTRKRGAPDRQTLQIVLNGKVVAESIIDDVIYRTRRLEAMDATPRFASG